jgi:chromosome transmission fidelity protein 4
VFSRTTFLSACCFEHSGEQGIVYGSHADGDLPALVHYRAYDTWASGADWQVSLPAGEEPVLLAAGGKPLANEFEVECQNMGSVIVATSRGFIRFFTGSGVQRYLWRMGEEMVSMAASDEMVFLVHREGGTSLDGVSTRRMVSSPPPILPRSLSDQDAKT